MMGTYLNCIGKCKRDYETKSQNVRNGWKYCSKCTVHINFNGTYCPCCRQKLRIQPANRDESLVTRI